MVWLTGAIVGLAGFTGWLARRYVSHLEKENERLYRAAERGTRQAERGASVAEKAHPPKAAD